MENFSYSSYPDSRDSSPRSREIDCENASWEEPPSNYKVKFMCSYGGKIHPRPHDNQLAYVGGETKILTVDRNIRFSIIIAKLSSLCDSEVYFKYQLPGEDLDALISVTNDEDLEHMMLEYDRLHRSGSRPARLRLFLFPLVSSNQSSFSGDEPKANQQWFVDALNSVPIQSLDSSSPSAAAVSASNPDFLFGLEKRHESPLSSPPPPPPVIEPSVPEPKVLIGSDSGRDERYIGGGGEPMVSPVEIQRQIQELQRLQIANQEQAMFQRKNEENQFRGYHGDYYMPKVPEKPAPPVTQIPVPVQSTAIPPYWQDNRHIATGGYPAPVTGVEQQQQQVYVISSSAGGGGGMYQTPQQNVRQVTGQVGQGYYAMQRMVPDVYREQPVYSMGPPPPIAAQSQPSKLMGGMMMGDTGGGGGGYTQMAYDSTGRQVYYTAGPPGGVVPSSYQTVTNVGVDPRQSGPLNQEGKVVKPPQ